MDDLGTPPLCLGEMHRMREAPLRNRTPMLDGDGTMSDSVKSWIEERRAIHAAAESPWWTTRDLQPATVFAGDGSADDLAVLTTFEHSDATAIVDAHNNLPRALDALNAVLELADEWTPPDPCWDDDGEQAGGMCDQCEPIFELRKAIEGAINDE